MATFPHPAIPLRQESYTSAAEPSMGTEPRYFGRVKAVNTTPPSFTIIPEDRTSRPDYDLAFGLSNIQLVEFLNLFASGEMRVSYVLRPGPTGALLVQDVQSAETVIVKEEGSPSWSADGPGEGKVERGKDVTSQVGFLASQHDRITLEEEARRNAKGEFRNRMGGLPSHFRAMKWDEWNAEGGRARRG